MSDAGDKRLETLILGLIEKTEKPAGEPLKWERVGESTYEISLTHNTIRISSAQVRGEYPYTFEVIDGGGRTSIQIEEGPTGFNYHLDELYQVAIRSNSGIDEKISELLRELGIPEREEPPF